MVRTQPPPPSSSSVMSEEDILDKPLHMVGFEYAEISGQKVSGYLKVTSKCCQPFDVLHGGVTTMMAESLASMGACLACGLKRVAGIHVSISHFKSAQLGNLVYAEATPLSVGKRIQVWEVRFWKSISSNPDDKILISSSRVTLMSNMPLPENSKDVLKAFRKHAKLCCSIVTKTHPSTMMLAILELGLNNMHFSGAGNFERSSDLRKSTTKNLGNCTCSYNKITKGCRP